jgi:DNA-binding GntR family transcriptional regulator
MLKHRETFDREHRGLLEALEKRDGDAAAALLEQHITGAAGHLIHELKGVEATASGTAASRSIG